MIQVELLGCCFNSLELCISFLSFYTQSADNPTIYLCRVFISQLPLWKRHLRRSETFLCYNKKNVIDLLEIKRELVLIHLRLSVFTDIKFKYRGQYKRRRSSVINSGSSGPFCSWTVFILRSEKHVLLICQKRSYYHFPSKCRRAS